MDPSASQAVAPDTLSKEEDEEIVWSCSKSAERDYKPDLSPDERLPLSILRTLYSSMAWWVTQHPY